MGKASNIVRLLEEEYTEYNGLVMLKQLGDVPTSCKSTDYCILRT